MGSQEMTCARPCGQQWSQNLYPVPELALGLFPPCQQGSGRDAAGPSTPRKQAHWSQSGDGILWATCPSVTHATRAALPAACCPLGSSL